MKKLKTALKYLLICVIGIPLLVTVYLFASAWYYLGGTDKKYTAYLQGHSAKVDISGYGKPIPVEESFYHHRVFLLGEIHGYEDVQTLDCNLFIQLNKKTGLRYYIAEMDSSCSGQLNNFLAGATPDTMLLKKVVKQIGRNIPQQSSRQLFEKWRFLHQYNSTLPENQKIVVLGIDKDLSDTSRAIRRDSAMMLNLQRYIAERKLDNEKFYGLFGFFHVIQSGTGENNRKPFAALLKNAPGFQAENVRSLVCFPVESKMYMPKMAGFPDVPDQSVGWLNVDGPFFLLQGIKDLEAVSTPNSNTYFRLDAGQSPYRSSNRLGGVKARVFGEPVIPYSARTVTTDLYQDVLLLRGSRALKGL